jgi:plastocyanin
MFRRRRILGVASAALALALGAAACGDDEAATDASEITVTADEYSFDLSTTPTAETKSISFENVGEEPHALIFVRLNEGFTLEEAFKLQGRKGSAEVVADEAQAKPGESTTARVGGPLEPGSYAMVCPLRTKDGESHFSLGQQQEFQITE